MEDTSLRDNPTASAKSPSSHSSWLMTGSAWDERGSWACCTATQLQPRPCGRLAIDSRTIRISVKLCSIDEMRCRISGASSSSVVRKGFAADADGDIADGGGAAWALPSIQPEIFGATCMQKKNAPQYHTLHTEEQQTRARISNREMLVGKHCSEFGDHCHVKIWRWLQNCS